MFTIRFNSLHKLVICIGIVTLICLYYFNKSEPPYDSPVNLVDVLKTAIQAAEIGGKFVVSVKDEIQISLKGKTLEGLDDSVTTADFLSHCAMVDILKTAYPAVKLISEEKNTQCDNFNIAPYNLPIISLDVDKEQYISPKNLTIWIDPLDATYEFTEKLYDYVTTMVCVAMNGKPIIGVIHSPFSKSTSWAWVGGGSSADLKPKVISQKHKIIISRSHGGQINDMLNKNFKDYEVVIAAGAGYKSLKVARGEVDAYLHTTLIKKWDICAGNAILNALGGRMTTKHNQIFKYYNESDIINKDGLVATMKDHNFFVDKL